MEFVKYFPEGVALGKHFINRESERELLINKIKTNQHSILMAPRRYGKTSLVMKVADEMSIPYCAIDLLASYSEEYVRDLIVEKIGALIFELLPRANKARERLMMIFKRMKPEITVGAFGQKLSLHLSHHPLQDITELLMKLDETAKLFKKRAVIFLDEFQQLSQLKNFHALEAAIRHAVERSTRIAYVFSGSNRQLLEQMFGDHGRPLYRLCQTVTIERMEKAVYVKHLQRLAQIKWKKKMTLEVLDQICSVTELHPFFMNVLCQIVWERKHIPTVEGVNQLWDDYVKTQKHIISHDLGSLSTNQKHILMALAKAPIKEVQSAAFIHSVKIPASSVLQAVDVLLRKDLIHIAADGRYHVLDPAMRYYLDVIL